MIVKDNQPTLRADLEGLFARHAAATAAPAESRPGLARQALRAVGEAPCLDAVAHTCTHDVGHGRIERRHLDALDVPEWLDWPGSAQVFRLDRQTQFKKDGSQRADTVYGITSLTATQAAPAALLQMCRGHWGIENRSHWVRDVTFDEDRSTVHKGSIPQVMAALRNTVIGRLRLHGHTNIAAARRTCAGHAHKVLDLIHRPPTFE